MKENRSLRNLLAVGGATGSRLVGILLLYALLARMLGPAKFGEFTYWYTIGIVLGALSDYGFGQQILIRLSADTTERIKEEGERVLVAKLILVFGFFAVALIVAILDQNERGNIFWIAPLLLACACATLVDFFGVMLRARGRYQNEALRSFMATFVASVGAAISGYLTDSLFVVCFVMLAIRIPVLYFQYFAAKEAVGFETNYKTLFNLRGASKTLNNGVKFAVDGGAVQLLTNIDVLIAKYILSSEAAGIYMAGSRLVQAALAGVPVLSNVFIPSLVAENKSGNNKTPRLMLVVIGVVGLLALVVFWIGAGFIPVMLFGESFASLSNIMPMFGLIVALRYLSSIDGFRLIIREKQFARVVIHIALVIFVSMFILWFSLYDNFTEVELASSIAFAAILHLVAFRLVASRTT